MDVADPGDRPAEPARSSRSSSSSSWSWPSSRSAGAAADAMPVEPPVATPHSLAEAYALLAAAPAEAPLRPVAGATDLLVQMTGEIGTPPAACLDLWRLDELRGIAVQPADGGSDEQGSLVLGALTTFAEIRRSALCRELVPALVEAAATIGAAQIQNRATIGGNIANASPAGDSLPVLLATDADHRRRRPARRADRRGRDLLAGVPPDRAGAGRARAAGPAAVRARS